jgi:hypothetical protein
MGSTGSELWKGGIETGHMNSERNIQIHIVYQIGALVGTFKSKLLMVN